MDKRTIADINNIFLFTAPPCASINRSERYLSKISQIKVTAPPINAVKIINENMNLILRLSFIGFGAMYPIKISPSAAKTSFINGFSGRKTANVATDAPIAAEIISLFVVVGIFENNAAKYRDRISTVKLIRK